MPVVTFHNEHRSFDVDAGTNLRELMQKVHVTPYGPLAQLTNCRGHNFCGTCAVEVVDGKGVSPMGQDEEVTLVGNLAIAHHIDKNIRLSCQARIMGDVVVKTHPSRPIDKEKTRQRFALLGITTFFLLTFAAVFAFLLLDMIKQF